MVICSMVQEQSITSFIPFWIGCTLDRTSFRQYGLLLYIKQNGISQHNGYLMA